MGQMQLLLLGAKTFSILPHNILQYQYINIA
jgi:hypothetical protein